VSVPDAWVTVYTEDIGNTFGPKEFCKGFEPASLVVEVSEIVTHKADEPNPVVGLFDSDGLPREHLAEIDLLPIEADAAAGCEGGSPVMEWVIDVRKARINQISAIIAPV
jgi:hypothetical protein